MSRMEDSETSESSWSIETADSVHVGGKLLVRWSAATSQSSIRRDFIACYTFGSSSRKYIDYKQVEREGMIGGKMEFAAPSKPGKYIFRYLRADYSEMASSSAVTVRSALSVLLEEVKSQGMRGNTEAVLEMFETMMLQLKANDEAFHKQALESWRELQARRSNAQEEPSAPDRPEKESDVKESDVEASSESTQSAEDSEASGFGHERLLRLRVRGSGYYSQGRDAQGDSRMVMLGDSVMVEGDSAAAKSAAGLHLLVLRLSDLCCLFSQCYDTHHDGTAAERLSADISSKALEVAEPSRVLVLVTSQYAWEGYFSSPVLCDRLARCGADLDRLLAIQRNCSSWISSRYSTPYVLVGIPGRRSELRFSAEILGGSQGKKQAAELELVLVRGGEDWLPVAVRSGGDKPWIWSLPDPPGRESLSIDSSSSSSSSPQSSTVVAPGSLPALGHLALWALLTPPSLRNDKLVALLAPSHVSCLRAAMLSLGSEKRQLLKEISFSAGQVRPMALLVSLHPHDVQLLRAFTSILKVWIETPSFRSLLLDEALDVLINIYSISDSGDGEMSRPRDELNAVRLDAAQLLCHLIHDDKFSLRREILDLYFIKTVRKEVQRALILRISSLSKNADMAAKIVASPALNILADAVIPPSHKYQHERRARARQEEEDDRELRSDALLGIASLCVSHEMRIELLRLQILDPVISALVESDHTSLALEDASFSSATDTVAAAASAASSSSSSSTLSFSHSSPHINALIIIKNLAQTDVVLTKLHVEVQEEATREGEEATSSDRGGQGSGPVTTSHLDAADLAELESFSVWGVVAAGRWKREFRGKLAMIASSLLEKGSNFVCDQGDVALLTGQQPSREAAVASIRMCQQSGASAVILTLLGGAAQYPVLQHLPRDFGDVTIPVICIPKEEASRLQAYVELKKKQAASGSQAPVLCSLHVPVECRRKLVFRALPLLHKLLRDEGSKRKREDEANSEEQASKPTEARRKEEEEWARTRGDILRIQRLLGDSSARTLSGRGVRVLAMDGGGIRGLVLVELLRKVEADSGRRIHEIFDVICGTSAGGLLAMALTIGRTLEEIEEQFFRISSSIFRKGWFTTAQQLTYTGSKYDARLLEDLFREQYGNGSLLDTPARPFCFMTSTLASVVPAQPFIWRNYAYPLDACSRYPGTCDASLVTALRATSAAPSYFDDVQHELGRHLDGGCVANNPAAIGIHEAKCLFPNTPIECVVSLATGSPPVRALPGAGVGWQGVLNTVIYSASSVSRIADCLEDAMAEGSYYRFSPEGDAFDVPLDQTNRGKIEELQGATHQYISMQASKFHSLAHKLLLPRR